MTQPLSGRDPPVARSVGSPTACHHQAPNKSNLKPDKSEEGCMSPSQLKFLSKEWAKLEADRSVIAQVRRTPAMQPS